MKRLLFVWVLCVFLAAPSFADICNLGIDYDTGWPWPAKQRWKDIAGNMYAGSADTSWDSTPPDGWSQDYAGASVSVDYGVIGQQLAGTVTATGLKPNFAYQLKLEGLGSGWTNQTLGDLGRWSGSTGYLVFGYMVTDESGDVTAGFATDSSYHVLYRHSLSTGTTGSYGFGTPGVNDGPVIWSTFDPDTSSPWYDTDYSESVVGVYGLHESGRPLPGALQLPIGSYSCKFVLTEESFHDDSAGGIYAGAPSGAWASPFKGDIDFVVVPVPGAVLLGILGLSVAGMKLRKYA